MGIISIVGKIFLGIVNSLLLIIGLVLFVVGVLIVSGSGVYTSLKSTLDEQLKSATSQAGVSNLDTSNLSLSELLEPLAWALIAIGIVMAGLAIFGLIVLCCTFKILLAVYTIVIGVIFLIQLIVVILLYADKEVFADLVKPHMKDMLKDYAGLEGTDTNSLLWNALMTYESCCGVDDYNDFHEAGSSLWPPTSVNGYTFTDQKTPIMCCKTITGPPYIYTCAEMVGATDANNNQNIGCYDEIYDLIVNNAAVISAFAILLALQAVCIFFCIWILCTMDNKIDII